MDAVIAGMFSAFSNQIEPKCADLSEDLATTLPSNALSLDLPIMLNVASATRVCHSFGQKWLGSVLDMLTCLFKLVILPRTVPMSPFVALVPAATAGK
jgi:hypothetical protein